MINKICHNVPPGGLGDAIGLLSVLLATGCCVEVTESYPMLCQQLKKIFLIPDQKLTVNFDKDIISDNWLTLKSKLFVPYFPTHAVNVFDKCYKIDRSTRKKKPCIALCAYSDENMADQLDSSQRQDFPYNRVYPRSLWKDIYHLCINANYDVIYINRTDISVEQKVFLLNELCDAVICAEGGIAHLAHLLKIPTIILPWHHWIDGTTSPYQIYVAHGLHVDPRTWFLESADELLSWSTNQLEDTIQRLYLDQGNNAYLSGLLQIDHKELCTRAPLHTWLDTMISDQEKEFLHKYIVNVA